MRILSVKRDFVLGLSIAKSDDFTEKFPFLASRRKMKKKNVLMVSL